MRKRQPTLAFLPGKSHGQEPGGLQFKGSQRVGHNWVTKVGKVKKNRGSIFQADEVAGMDVLRLGRFAVRTGRMDRVPRG